MRRRGERNHVRQHTQKRRPGTILDEGPSIHLSSLWPPLTQESTVQVSAVLGQPASTSSPPPPKKKACMRLARKASSHGGKDRRSFNGFVTLNKGCDTKKMTASAKSLNKESSTAGRCEGISTRALAVTQWEHFQRRFFFFFIVVLISSAFGDKRRGGEKRKRKIHVCKGIYKIRP